MWTSRPATGASFALYEFFPRSLDMELPRLRFLHGLYPTKPLVTRERGDALPLFSRFW